jgi:hypothetical protein
MGGTGANGGMSGVEHTRHVWHVWRGCGWAVVALCWHTYVAEVASEGAVFKGDELAVAHRAARLRGEEVRARREMGGTRAGGGVSGKGHTRQVRT